MTKSTEQKQKEEKNTLWQRLEKTDPEFAKKFDNGRFKGTAINPTYAVKKMTEIFGAIGTGWKYDVDQSEIWPAPSGDVMVYKTVSLYYMREDGTWSLPVHGYGGDYLFRASSKKPDDDAHKKATTDAIGNAMKMLGMSADVYMGRYDDSKYVQELLEGKAEIKNAKNEKDVQNGQALVGSMRDGVDAETVKQMYDQALKDIAGCIDLVALKNVWGKINKGLKVFTEEQRKDLEQAKEEAKKSMAPF